MNKKNELVKKIKEGYDKSVIDLLENPQKLAKLLEKYHHG